MWKPLTIVLATGVLAGCGAVPALRGAPAVQAPSHANTTPATTTPPPPPWVPPLANPAPAAPASDGSGYVCWDAYGNPQPQASPTCPSGWGGRPPEHPLAPGDPNTGIVP
jgi:hypothetical protein